MNHPCAACALWLFTAAQCLATPPAHFASREPMPKTPNEQLRIPANATGRVFVKFVDSLRLRVTDAGDVYSASGGDISDVRRILDEFELDISPAITHSEDSLAEIEHKAMEWSAKAQPDLAGMMHVQGQANMMPAARALNNLDAVEFVAFDAWPSVHGGDGGGGAAGFDSCVDGDGPCLHAHLGAGCHDAACCQEVCAVQPFCCEWGWDFTCANLAAEFCIPPPSSVCDTAAGACTQAHGGVGCKVAECCYMVCAWDPNCCDEAWDAQCASYADDVCDHLNAPNFESLQWYLSAETGGYNLEYLQQVAKELEHLSLGEPVNLRGKGLKVGVIGYAYIEDHEELGNVTLEPGVTQFIFPPFFEPHHDTACLSLLVARDNGFGITGILPEAKAHFFPIVSADQPGGRLFSALTGAIATLEAGDVLSISIGFPPGPLTTHPGVTVMLWVAADLGILSVQSAGDECTNLDTVGINAGPSTVVGAGVYEDTIFGDCPGIAGDLCELAGAAGVPRPHYSRTRFSNYFEINPVIDCQGPGENLVTAGYGGLYMPDGDITRSYTQTFCGTSAAAPLTAGVLAKFQGLARQIFGFPLAPTTIRSFVTNNVIPQNGGEPLLGIPEGAPCDLCCETLAFPEFIGGFPHFPGALTDMMTANMFDDSIYIDGVTIFRGELLLGNHLSLKASDNLRLVVRSEYTEPSDSAHELGSGPEPQYYLHAYTTDIEVRATMPANPTAPIGQIILSLECASTASNFTSFIIVEALNWNTGRREFVGFDLQIQFEIPPPFGYNHVFAIPNATRFINSNDEVALRLWTVALGGTTISPFTQRYDFMQITATDENGEIIPP